MRMETDGFTLVSKRKGRRSRNSKTKRTSILNNVTRGPIDAAKVITKIDNAVVDLKTSKFFTDISPILNICVECKTIWCFGLGHLGDCITARFQFALLLLIKDVLNNEDVFLCDPIFYDEEVDILNIECMLECKTPTFVFLPH